MSHLKSTTLISLLSLSLFSCAPKDLNIKEAGIVIDNIENKLNDSTFDFPTKITINKLIKKSNQYIDKLAVRFSLDDLFLYYSNGFEEGTLNEYWHYVDKDEGKFYHLTSITKNNSPVLKHYTVTEFNEKDNVFAEKYFSLKELVINECSTFKETLSALESLNTDSDNNKLKISSTSEKNIELDASISLSANKVSVSQSFENYLPKVSNVYKVNENKEEKNYETKYYYNGVNITRPNLHNFSLIN